MVSNMFPSIFRFESPHLLWLLLIIPLMVGYYIYRQRLGRARVQVSTTSAFQKNIVTWRSILCHITIVLRSIAVGCIIVALARPQSAEDFSSTNAEGVDIVMSLDISGSMLARDFNPNRLEAAKDITSKFIIGRPTDRIGLVVFAGEAFTQSPLTTDHTSLVNLLNQVQMGFIDDGTAIGNGLATAINRLRESDSPSKVIILLTDGVNNCGQIDPKSAADIARDYGIRVYTIGVGTMGMAPYPVYNAWGELTYQNVKVEIDEKLLTSIAEETGGHYFRATDNTKLAEIYSEIQDMEKTKVEVENFRKYSEVFHPFLLAALFLLCLEIICNLLVFKRLP